MPDVASFQDTFSGSSLSTAWGDLSPDSGSLTVSGGMLTSAGMHVGVPTVASYTFAPWDQLIFHIKTGEFPGYVTVGVGNVTFSTHDYYGAVPQFWVKIYRALVPSIEIDEFGEEVPDADGIRIAVRASEAAIWTEYGGNVDYATAYTAGPITLDFEGQWEVHSIIGSNAVPPDDPGGADLEDVPDHFTPTATAPSVPPPPSIDPNPIPIECYSLLDEIRAFSTAVRRAVRITGPTKIEMVNPNAPLPAGWTVDDAGDLYATTTHALVAGEGALSMAYGDLALSVGATIVSDDVRIVTSTWRIPDRLPVYGLQPAPVKRISYTFTPRHFTASVEFHVPTVPLILRRT